MRIAFFADTYRPAMDGVVRSVDVFRDGLRAGGHTVKIFAPAPPRRSDRESGVSYAASVSFPAYPQYRIPLHTSGVAAAAEKFRPDIVHSHAMVRMGLAARDAARRLGVPLVGTFHTLLPEATHYIMPLPRLRAWTGRALWNYLHWFYSPFDEVLAPSRFMQKRLAEHQIGSVVLPTPVDTQKFCPAKKNAKKERAGEKEKMNNGKNAGQEKNPAHKTILFVGRVAKEKNLGFLLGLAQTKGWKRWERDEPRLRLLIAGDGPYRHELEGMVRRLPIGHSVRLLGRVPDAELIELYRSAACVIQPSKFETQGLTALEAMACGTPVAVMEGTALAEVVQPGRNGELFGDDGEEAVMAVQRIMERRAAYSKAARKKAMEFSVEKCTKKLVKVYKKVG